MTDNKSDKNETDGQENKAAPEKVREQDPKNAPAPGGSQVADINPTNVQTGHRDREQI